MAETTGLPNVSRRRSRDLPSRTNPENSTVSALVTRLRSFRSPPAKNVLFALVMTTPVMASFSASSRSTVALIEAR